MKTATKIHLEVFAALCTFTCSINLYPFNSNTKTQRT